MNPNRFSSACLILIGGWVLGGAWFIFSDARGRSSRTGLTLVAVFGAFGLLCVLIGIYGASTGRQLGSRRSPDANLTRAQAGRMAVFLVAGICVTAFIAYKVLNPPERTDSPAAPIIRSAEQVWHAVEAQARNSPKHQIPAFDSAHLPAWWTARQSKAELLSDVHYRVATAVVGRTLNQVARGTAVLTLDGPVVTRAFGHAWTLRR